MPTFSKKQLGSWYAILSGLCYGLVGYFGIGIINAGLSVYDMTFWRFVIATIFIGLLLVSDYKKIFPINKRNLKLTLFTSLFYSCASILYFFSSVYIGTGVAMVVFFIYPAMVILLNKIIFSINIRSLYYLATIIIMLGLVVLADIQDANFNIIGIALGVLSALSYAGYILFTKSYEIPAMVSTFLVSIGCAAISFILAILDNSLVVPNSSSLWIDLIGIATICTAIPILLMQKGLQYISSSKASLLSVLEPVFVVIFGALLLNEPVTMNNIIGISLVLGGAIIAILT